MNKYFEMNYKELCSKTQLVMITNLGCKIQSNQNGVELEASPTLGSINSVQE